MSMNITEQIQEAIEASGVSAYRVAKDTGLPKSTLTNVAKGKSITTAVAEKIMDYIGYEAVVRKRGSE